MTTLERLLSKHPAVNRKSAQTLTSAIWGGIAQEYDALKAELDKLTVDAEDVDGLSGDELDELVLRITGIERYFQETDESRILLLAALFRRNNIPSWGTVHSIRQVFSEWYDSDQIFIREGEVETNLIEDGSFEALSTGAFSGMAADGEWVSTGSDDAYIAETETFEGVRVLVLEDAATAMFEKPVAAGAFMLSAAYKGSAPVVVQRDSDNYYWNFATRGWQVASTQLNLENEEAYYTLFEAPIVIDGTYNVSVSFGPDAGASGFRLDYVSFGEKPAYPYLHVIISTASNDGVFMNAWPGGSDPVSGTDYDHSTYIGMDFIGGSGGATAQSYYQSILEIIKTAGAKALFEYIGGVP